MESEIIMDFQPFSAGTYGGDLVVFVDDQLDPADQARTCLRGAYEQVTIAARKERFTGKLNGALILIAPPRLSFDRVVLIGIGSPKDRSALDWVTLGGVIGGYARGRRVTVVGDAPGVEVTAQAAADMSLGARLRLYRFDLYKTKVKHAGGDAQTTLTFQVADPAAATTAGAQATALAAGVCRARDLVNEPPNILHPEEFAHRAATLARLGVYVEILEVDNLARMGFRALLATGSGSARASRVVILRWSGGAPETAPVAVIGKGVTFDSGGISIKGSAGMETMKGDMAGAACVVGLMHALAGRKASANVIGVIGLTENMPDGNALRPSDILTTLSGQTVEVISTDAEGRLVLADLLWHVQTAYKPKLMIDLATLTGATIVALGKHYAGLLSNDDTLAAQLSAAGLATGEKVWRLPMGDEYAAALKSDFADMKNTAGRPAGAIIAGEFLQAFVNGCPWAHLDIAGTGMDAPATETSRSWGTGWGVRLLDRLIRDHHEEATDALSS